MGFVGAFEKIRRGFALEDFRQKLNQIKIGRFEPKVYFEDQKDRYTIRTAHSPEDVREVLKLRHEIFIKEGLGRELPSGMDFDRYDLMADHILLIDNEANKVIGTYRILCTDFCHTFYSQTEFNIDRLLDLPGSKLELGRACIAKDFRKGISLHLIWKALCKYARITGADYMFGCASVHTTQWSLARAILEHLKPDHYTEELGIHPIGEFVCKEMKGSSSLYSVVENVEEHIPALIQSYLRAGAKVHGVPAYDRWFECFDFLTVMNLRELPQKYQKKYLEV